MSCRVGRPGGKVLDEAIRLFRRTAALPPAFLLTAGMAVFVAASMFPLVEETCTTDEGVHLPAGYTYLTRADFRLNPEHPPLAKLVSAFPLLFMEVGLPDGRDWEEARQWEWGYRFLNHANDPERLLFWGRLAALVWPLLLIPGVFLTARRLYGNVAALVSLLVSVCLPDFLAHGHLVTTDVPAAAGAFYSVLAFHAYLSRPSPLRSALAGVVVGLSLCTKFNVLFVLPVMAVLAFARRGRPSDPEGPRLPGRLGHALLGVAVGVATIWAVYGFRYSASLDPTLTFEIPSAGQPSLLASATAALKRIRALPEAYLHGLNLAYEASQAREAFAFGRHSVTGWVWYFPAAFLVKTPPSLLILLVLAGTGILLRRARGSRREQFLVIPLLAYAAVLLTARMNIGYRHAMPALPFLLVLVGGAAVRPRLGHAPGRGRAATLALSLIALPADVFIQAPHYLAYFSPLSLAVRERHEMLVDSNLDWGQDLGRLKEAADELDLGDLKLAYFGSGSPRALGLAHQRLPCDNVYGRLEPEWPLAESISEGDVVAISASHLVGLRAGDRESIQPLVRELAPIRWVGRSILLMRASKPLRLP